MYEHALTEPAIDAVVLGRRRGRVAGLVEALGRGDRLDGMEGLAFRCGDGFCACAEPPPTNVHARTRSSRPLTPHRHMSSNE